MLLNNFEIFIDMTKKQYAYYLKHLLTYDIDMFEINQDIFKTIKDNISYIKKEN